MSALGTERGNVTLITALVSLLIVMIVILGSGLSQVATDSTRMQAASDDAAVTAATSYIAIVNDSVLFDLIDWGLGFVQRMAEILNQIGNIIAAIPFLEGIGAAISAVAIFIKQAAKTLQNVFKQVKNALKPILEKAKNILNVINATVYAANNGYIGFILPNHTLTATGQQSQFTPDDVKHRVDHALQLTNDGHLQTDILAEAVHTIWGGDAPLDKAKLPPCPKSLGTTGNGQPVPGQSCAEEPRLGGLDWRDTFHLWSSTPTCVEPPAWVNPPYGVVDTQGVPDFNYAPDPDSKSKQWHRPCDEHIWLRQLMQQYYYSEVQSVDSFERKLNLNDPSAPQTFKPSDPSDPVKTQKEKDNAFNSLEDAKKKIIDAAGNSKGPVMTLAAQFDGKADFGNNETQYCPINGLPRRLKSQDPADPGDYISFKCEGKISFGKPAGLFGVDNCDGSKNNPPTFPCLAFWDINIQAWLSPDDITRNVLPVTAFPSGAPQDHPTDFRYTDHYNIDKYLADWKRQKFSASIAGDDSSSGTDEEDFIMVGQVLPSRMEQFARGIAGKSEQKPQFAITASIVNVYRAQDKRDAARVGDLCAQLPFITPDDPNDHNHIDKLLGFLPATAYGWCHVLLGFFDLLVKIRGAISDFFNTITGPIRDFSFTVFGTHICPFCWIADIIDALVEYVIGPEAPDARTYHISLATVDCIPALDKVATVAGALADPSPSKLIDAVKAISGSSANDNHLANEDPSCHPGGGGSSGGGGIPGGGTGTP